MSVADRLRSLTTQYGQRDRQAREDAARWDIQRLSKQYTDLAQRLLPHLEIFSQIAEENGITDQRVHDAREVLGLLRERSADAVAVADLSSLQARRTELGRWVSQLPDDICRQLDRLGELFLERDVVDPRIDAALLYVMQRKLAREHRRQP